MAGSTIGFNLTQQHPLYLEFLEDQVLLRDGYKGQRRIKDEGVIYLSPTSGQIADGATDIGITGSPESDGQAAYDAYKKRAVYHNFIKRAVKAALGVMHSKPATIELPEKLEYLLDRATTKGENLQMLLRKINEDQLIEGRVGLLLDLPKQGGGMEDLYISLYNARSIINWDDGEREDLTLGNLNLVVLDETGFERKDTFQWSIEHRFRVLVLGELEPNEGETSGAVYKAGVFLGKEDNVTFAESELVELNIQGQILNEIPFVFINSRDLVVTPEEPPQLDLANLALTVYRGEADYRQNLFMQGQDTLVIIGGNKKKGENERVGAGALLRINQGGDAKYIGVDSKGLPEQRLAIENDKQEAGQLGGQLLDTSTRTKESEGALNIRVSGQTATLNEIALAGAKGLENILKVAARWVGANDDEVKVTPNLDFVNDKMDAETLRAYMEAYIMGAPISLKTIHNIMRKKDVTTLEFEEELDNKEGDMLIGVPEGPVDEGFNG